MSRSDLKPEINVAMAMLWVTAMLWVAFNQLHLIADRIVDNGNITVILRLIYIHTLITNLTPMNSLPPVLYHTLDQNHTCRDKRRLERIQQQKWVVLLKGMILLCRNGMRMVVMDEMDFGGSYVVEVDVIRWLEIGIRWGSPFLSNSRRLCTNCPSIIHYLCPLLSWPLYYLVDDRSYRISNMFSKRTLILSSALSYLYHGASQSALGTCLENFPRSSSRFWRSPRYKRF